MSRHLQIVGNPTVDRGQGGSMPAQAVLDFTAARNAKRSRTYYPTTPMSADQLQGAIAVADNQDELVLAIFRRHAGHDLTPSRVWDIGKQGGRAWLLTSVRRSITNLTEDGYLQKAGHQTLSPYGRPENAWRLWSPGSAA